MGHSARGDAASVRIAGLRIERSFMLSSLDRSFLVLEHVQIGILDQLGWRHAQMRHDLVRFSDASGLGLTVLQHHFKFPKFTYVFHTVLVNPRSSRHNCGTMLGNATQYAVGSGQYLAQRVGFRSAADQVERGLWAGLIGALVKDQFAFALIGCSQL